MPRIHAARRAPISARMGGHNVTTVDTSFRGAGNMAQIIRRVHAHIHMLMHKPRTCQVKKCAHARRTTTRDRPVLQSVRL